MNSAQNKQQYVLQSYLTAPYACSYLPDHTARSQVVVPVHLIDTFAYSLLIKHGFRRGGAMVYRPACDACQACISIRVPVNDFVASRSQKKASKQLAHLKVQIHELHEVGAIEEDAYFTLYKKYQKARHPGGGMDEDNREQYDEFLSNSQVRTQVIAYKEAASTPDASDVLRMVSVVDVLRDGISAVYTYYDPHDLKRSYGTYGILWQIAYAQALQLPYVYLGFWIEACPKMRYKNNFHPFEMLTPQGWERQKL